MTGTTAPRRPLLFLDSASLEDASIAAGWGFVGGITTNPTLMAREAKDPIDQLQALLDVFPGLVFYQPGANDITDARSELERAGVGKEVRLVAKLPARLDFVQLASELTRQAVRCALTAVYAPGQALLATGGGVKWVIPYVDRARRLMENGDRLVFDLAAILDRAGSHVHIVAASIRSPAQAIQALLDGAHAVSAPLDVLAALAEHPLTAAAIEEFAAAARDPDENRRSGSS